MINHLLSKVKGLGSEIETKDLRVFSCRSKVISTRDYMSNIYRSGVAEPDPSLKKGSYFRI